MSDEVYSSKANRKPLCARGVQAVIPKPADQIANRKRRGSRGGSRGGRPPSLYREIYKRCDVKERFFKDIKQWRGIGTRYDELAMTYRGGVVVRAIII